MGCWWTKTIRKHPKWPCRWWFGQGCSTRWWIVGWSCVGRHLCFCPYLSMLGSGFKIFRLIKEAVRTYIGHIPSTSQLDSFQWYSNSTTLITLRSAMEVLRNVWGPTWHRTLALDCLTSTSLRGTYAFSKMKVINLLLAPKLIPQPPISHPSNSSASS